MNKWNYIKLKSLFTTEKSRPQKDTVLIDKNIYNYTLYIGEMANI